MTHAYPAWIVVRRRGGAPAAYRDGHLKVFKTRKAAKTAANQAGGKDDVVKVTMHYEWEWLPKGYAK